MDVHAGSTPPRTLKDTGLGGGTAWGHGLLTAVPPLTETCCPWGNTVAKSRSRALWRHLLAPKGTLTPALIHSCIRKKSMSSDIPLQQQIGTLGQRKGLAQGHRAGGSHVVWSWAQGCLLAITIPVVPITAPTAQLSILPQNHLPKVADPSSALLLPAPPSPPSQAHPACGAASAASLSTTALPFAAGMLAGGRGLGCRRCRGCRQQGERGTDNPSEEGHGGLTEPIHVLATCSPLQCSHLTHPLCTSLLPSGVAITAEAGKQLRGCFKTARDPLPLQLRGWARGSTQPQHGPQLLTLSLGTASLPGSGRTRSRTMRPQNLQHIRDAAAALGQGRAPQQRILPAPMPA